MKQSKVLPAVLLTSFIVSQYVNAECLSGDCENGTGTFIIEDGRKYIGMWKNGSRDGQGSLTWPNGDHYVGLWKNDKMNGEGTFSGLAGWKYIGQWENSEMHGHGEYTWANGDKYVGLWKNGKRHGQGTHTLVEGEEYIGQWEDGNMHGYGSYTWPDGKKYLGQWKADLPDGQGTYSWPNGTEYIGQFKAGKRHGQGSLTLVNGAKYIGLWKDDQEDGRGTYYSRKGLVRNKIYDNGTQIDSTLVFKKKAWYPKQGEHSAFLGRYRSADSETASELYVLDDNTFCFTFTGGSLDLMIAGTWAQSKQQTNRILLKETKIDKPIHPARAQQLNRLDNKISITINGYGLDGIKTPVFAFSQESTPPTTFRPLLPKNNNIGRATYAFPLFSPSAAKYFYLGSIVTSNADNENALQVTQYEIGSYDTFQVAYDTEQHRSPESFDLELIDDAFLINGDPADSKIDLFPEMVKAVKEQCINPARRQDNSSETMQWATLTPSKTFHLNTDVISSEHYFSKGDGEQARRVNGINELIEDEKKILAEHYKKAEKDKTSFNELLVVAKALLAKKDRKDIYIEDISMKLPQLLVNSLQRGEIAYAREQFNAYATQIYPLIKYSGNKQVQYSTLVVASQGAVIYGATRDKSVLTTMFDTLLGEKFDIETTTNPTLVYNLACIYSLTNNKSEMLKAITVAKKMQIDSNLFLKDSDFSFYKNDSDFLNAIN